MGLLAQNIRQKFAKSPKTCLKFVKMSSGVPKGTHYTYSFIKFIYIFFIVFKFINKANVFLNFKNAKKVFILGWGDCL